MIVTPENAERLLQQTEQVLNYLYKGYKPVPETDLRSFQEPSLKQKEDTMILLSRSDGTRERVVIKYNPKDRRLFSRLLKLSSELRGEDPDLYRVLNLDTVIGVIRALFEHTYTRVLRQGLARMMKEYLKCDRRTHTLEKVRRFSTNFLQELSELIDCFTLPNQYFRDYLLVLSSLISLGEMWEKELVSKEDSGYFLDWIVQNIGNFDPMEFRNKFIDELVERDQVGSLVITGPMLLKIGEEGLEKAKKASNLNDFYSFLYLAGSYLGAALASLNFVRRNVDMNEKERKEFLNREVWAEELWVRTFTSISNAGIFSTLLPKLRGEGIVEYYKSEVMTAHEEGFKKGGLEAASFAVEMKKREIVYTDYCLPPYLIDKLSFSEKELEAWQKARSLKRFQLMSFLSLWRRFS
ncbi:MAG TPA: hypothetical protein EYP68_08670 [Candidatus Korarchaeota archaeon]|nr:hypothetical protein [Candidatus Korarchaeota archaeon]